MGAIFNKRGQVDHSGLNRVPLQYGSATRADLVEICIIKVLRDEFYIITSYI